MANELIKSKERVSEHGEVFTPQHIVLEMLDLVKKEWSDPETILLEPTCGTGNFIIEMLKKRIEAGIKIFPALNTIFGMDIMADNIQECHIRVYEVARDYFKLKGEQDKYKEACIKTIAIVENNIVCVEDSLAELDRSNGDSNFDKKKFFKTDPTGNSMVLSEAEQEKVIKAIEKRWDAIENSQLGIDKIKEKAAKTNDKIDSEMAKIDEKLKGVKEGEDDYYKLWEEKNALWGKRINVKKLSENKEKSSDTIAVFLA